MTSNPITFSDGAAYERYMGVWSQKVGDDFLSWIAPSKGLRWLDIGCGNGAFTETIVQRCAPASVDGVDPSQAQLDFARRRPALSAARFRPGDAMALPFSANAFDVAVMPLVIFFVPDPFQGVAEMARVVTAGGLVTAYGWDLTGGGFPYSIVQKELEELGIPRRREPSPDAADLSRLRDFWTAAGLLEIETKVINAQRTFANVEEFWEITRGSPNLGPSLAAMTPDIFSELKARVAKRVQAAADGSLTLTGRAHAVRGRVPA